MKRIGRLWTNVQTRGWGEVAKLRGMRDEGERAIALVTFASVQEDGETTAFATQSSLINARVSGTRPRKR